MKPRCAWLVGLLAVAGLAQAAEPGAKPPAQKDPPAMNAAALYPPALYPPAIAPGDTIMIVAPAKYLDEPRIRLARQRLEALGFRVVFPQTLFRKRGYLAGSDAERAAELMAAFNDPQVDAIFCGTGGYGTTRIVDDLDYDAIRRHPKVLIGFSDITGLHVAINQQTGLVTFHAPMPEYSFGNEKGFNPYAQKWFWRAIAAADRPTHDLPAEVFSRGYTITPRATAREAAWDRKAFADFPQLDVIAPGKARGKIIGGNLSVLHALMGTPYEIETDGKILMLEDVGEDPYRIDRMLSTLKLAGKFDHVAGVVLGCFTRRQGEQKWSDDWSMDDVLRDYFADLGVPVVNRYPVGHVPYNTTLPFGADAELDAATGEIRLLESPVAPPEKAAAQ